MQKLIIKQFFYVRVDLTFYPNPLILLIPLDKVGKLTSNMPCTVGFVSSGDHTFGLSRVCRNKHEYQSFYVRVDISSYLNPLILLVPLMLSFYMSCAVRYGLCLLHHIFIFPEGKKIYRSKKEAMAWNW